MEVGVKDVAAHLGVSERRVRQLIDAGSLPARRIAGRLLVEEAAIPRSRPVGRPMSARIAWAFIKLLSGIDPGVSDREVSRLRAKHRELLARPDPAVLLRTWLRSRAEILRLAAPAMEIHHLLNDPRVIPSGISDPRSGLSAGRDVEGYARTADIDGLVADHLLADVAPVNVWLHVFDHDLVSPAPLGLVIADLADRDGPREDTRVLELLRASAP